MCFPLRPLSPFQLTFEEEAPFPFCFPANANGRQVSVSLHQFTKKKTVSLHHTFLLSSLSFTFQETHFPRFFFFFWPTLPPITILSSSPILSLYLVLFCLSVFFPHSFLELPLDLSIPYSIN